MKNLFSTLLLVTLITYSAYSQVTINRSINLSGSGSDGIVTGIKQATQPADAVNADIVQKGGLIYATAGGNGNYTIALTPAPTIYTIGMVFNFIATNANTAPVAATLQVGALAALPIKKNVNVALGSGDIAAGQAVSVIYDGANFQLLAGSVPSGSGNYVQNKTTDGVLATGQSASMDITGNGEVGGTFGVGGNTKIDGTLAVGSIPSMFTNLQVNGKAQFGTTTQAQFLDANTYVQIMSEGNTTANLGFWQSGVASGLIGTKANDQNFYITNNYDGNVFGAASRSITLDRYGNVGVGTTSPAATLNIHNNDETGYMTALVDVVTKSALKIRPHASNSTSFYFGQGNTGNAHIIQAANGPGTGAYDIALNPFGGNIGFGTVAPNIVGSNSASRVLSIMGDGSLVNANGRIELASARVAGSLAPGDDAGRVMWVMNNNPGGALIGTVLTAIEGSGGANGFGSRMTFYTKPDNVVSTSERMRLDNAGILSIGTTGGYFNAQLQVRGTDYAVYGGTSMAAGYGGYFHNDDSGGNRFVKLAGGTYAAVFMNGNVGIGTISPGSMLQVNNSSGVTLGLDKPTGASIQFSRSGTAGYQIDDAAGDIRFLSGGATERMRILSSGNVGIGLTNPGLKFEVTGGVMFHDRGDGVASMLIQNEGGLQTHLYTFAGGDFQIHKYGSGSAGGKVLTILNGGNVSIGNVVPGGLFELSLDQGRKPSTVVWTTTSDARLKDITGSYTKGLKEILQLQPITYHYKNVGDRKFEEQVRNTLSIGFAAQDVQKIFPEAVGTDPDGYLNFNMHSILVAYVNAIKEQQTEIEQLKNENTALKSSDNDKDEAIKLMKAQIDAINERLNIKSER